MKKLLTLKEAISLIPDGCTLGLGGNTLNRAPMAAVFELIRRNKRGLSLVKTAGGMDVDALCFAGCVKSVDAGFVSYESKYSLARHYRRSVESGEVTAHEHACYTVISALRAASYGVGFMPVRGLIESDLIDANDYFTRTQDPFTGETITAVRAIAPDFAIIHAHMADESGNAMLLGPRFEDELLTRASKSVIVTAERIVDERVFVKETHKAQIPHFLVKAVVYAPRGAAPCACSGLYEPRDEIIREFLSLKSPDELPGWLSRRRL